ncbi:MAG: response regulator transcription factor [Clostridiales bacterium]|nr:response regulator transcription factor [Clostridiales bacterium]
MAKILVADDEQRIRRLVGDFLKASGFEVIEAEDGRQAVDLFKQNKDISVVVCDVMMPEMDGWEVCRQIRRRSDVPIIVLTARTQEFDELVSFESGADDFVTKPFSPTVLVKRIQALLKRSEGKILSEDGSIVKLDELILNVPAHTVLLDDVPVDLTVKEYKILEKLLSNVGRIYSRDNLLDDIWGIDYAGDPRNVDSHVARLRTKLGVWGEKHIKTVFGVGYKIIDD